MAKALKIDFTGTDTEIRRGGRSAHFPEGDYLFKVVKHEIRKTKDGKSRYISWQMQAVAPKKFKGKTQYHITSLKPDALWNLRNLIFACTGKNVAGKVANFVPESLYGKIFAGTTEDDIYVKNEGEDNEKEIIKSVLADIYPRAEYDEANSSDDDEEDEDDDDEDDEVDEDEDEEDEEEEDEDDEEDEEDEEDEPEPPRKKKSSAKRATGKAGKSKKKRLHGVLAGSY
jgi:hypothetical protein